MCVAKLCDAQPKLTMLLLQIKPPKNMVNIVKPHGNHKLTYNSVAISLALIVGHSEPMSTQNWRTTDA